MKYKLTLEAIFTPEMRGLGEGEDKLVLVLSDILDNFTQSGITINLGPTPGDRDHVYITYNETDDLKNRLAQ